MTPFANLFTITVFQDRQVVRFAFDDEQKLNEDRVSVSSVAMSMANAKEFAKMLNQILDSNNASST